MKASSTDSIAAAACARLGRASVAARSRTGIKSLLIAPAVLLMLPKSSSCQELTGEARSVVRQETADAAVIDVRAIFSVKGPEAQSTALASERRLSPAAQDSRSLVHYFGSAVPLSGLQHGSVSSSAGPQAPKAAGSKPALPDNDLVAKKLKYGLTQAFLTWGGYVTTALSAAVTEAREKDQPGKTTGDRAADGLSRYAIDFGTRTTKVFFADAIYPIIFKQSPCYKRSRRPDVPSRLLYAVIRVFVTETDNGALTVNASRIAGDLTAAALANAYEKNTPGFTRIGVTPTFTRFGRMLGTDALSLVAKEFAPDIKRLFHIK